MCAYAHTDVHIAYSVVTKYTFCNCVSNAALAKSCLGSYNTQLCRCLIDVYYVTIPITFTIGSLCNSICKIADANKGQFQVQFAIFYLFSLYQQTPLHLAAREGYVHAVRYLVQKHDDMHIKDCDGVSMRLHY